MPQGRGLSRLGSRPSPVLFVPFHRRLGAVPARPARVVASPRAPALPAGCRARGGLGGGGGGGRGDGGARGGAGAGRAARRALPMAADGLGAVRGGREDVVDRRRRRSRSGWPGAGAARLIDQRRESSRTCSTSATRGAGSAANCLASSRAAAATRS